jgi:Domain of unknown function (DUF4145)
MFYTNMRSPVKRGIVPLRERAEMISLYQPGSFGGEMKCPTCGENTPDAWERLKVKSGSHPIPAVTELDVPGPDESLGRERRIPDAWVVIDWMVCANWKCGELVMRMHETRPLSKEANEAGEIDTETLSWTIRPRFGTRSLPPEVQDPYRTDYLEAVAVLAVSPRLSAVLSRSILADLLLGYRGYDEFGLAARIDRFRADESHPSALRESIHHFREIADFGAHTMKNDQDQVIPVAHDDAEWMLDFLDRLFDYLIVGPEKDRAMRERWDSRIADAGRKPIEPLEES